MIAHHFNQGRLFKLSIGILCLAYLLFQCFNNYYTVWSVDDFWFAHRIYEFKNGLPYRDFSPYKTILGYYLLLPTMLLGQHALTPLLLTKQFIALINTVFFAITAGWLTRFFPKSAIFFALLLLISANFFLQYSTNIRVDLLAYWFCLFSVLYLLDNKFILAGILLGVAFATSQKVLWYIAASDIALASYWLFAARNKTIFYGAIKFNLAILSVIMIYIAIWATLSSLHTVLYNIFYEAYIMFQLDTYEATRKFFWQYTLNYNSLLFLSWPLFLITLFVSPQNDTNRHQRIFIAVYAAVILFCLIPYKQVFPYYMLTTLPAFILLYTAFFSWGIALFTESSSAKLHYIDKTTLLGMLLAYMILLTLTIITFALPLVTLSLLALPLLLGIRILNQTQKTLLIATPYFLSIIILFIGLIYPWALLINLLKNSPGNYQKSMVKLTEALLKSGGDYLAGIELIYNINQPIPGLRHLDAPAIIYLYHPTQKLAAAMLDSLYHTPDISIKQAIQYLENSSVKFYINNYRIHALPSKIKLYLNKNYIHFWGSIYLYAPTINQSQHCFNIKFPGNYLVNSTTPIIIDGVTIKPHSTIILNKGQHHSIANFSFRLILKINNLENFLNPDFKTDRWAMMLG